MHWVVREDSGIKDLKELAGQRFIPGGAGSAALPLRLSRETVAAIRPSQGEGVGAAPVVARVGLGDGFTVRAGDVRVQPDDVPARRDHH